MLFRRRLVDTSRTLFHRQHVMCLLSFSRIITTLNPQSFCSIGAVLIVVGGACYSCVAWGEGPAAAAAEDEGGEGYVVMGEGRGVVVALQ